jgi:CubicO group peptidase (beta-lactamase class C family)
MRLLPLLAVLGLAASGQAGQRLDPAAVERAAAYSASRGETALLVWQNGRVIYERGSSAAPRVFSITKSLVSVGVIRDAQAGGLSLSSLIRFPAARGATLADLLNQTSGLNPAQREFYSTGLRDKHAVLNQLTAATTPRLFAYGASHWEVLAEEIRLHRGLPLEGWLRRFVPGADSEVVARWRRDGQGVPFFSTGARMQPRELLPAAREVLRGLDRDKWPEQVRALFASGTPGNRMYALGFWLNRGATAPGAREISVENVVSQSHEPSFWQQGCLSRRAPSDLVAMIGTRGQRVYLVPSLDLAIIRFGQAPGYSDAALLGALFGR